MEVLVAGKIIAIYSWRISDGHIYMIYCIFIEYHLGYWEYQLGTKSLNWHIYLDGILMGFNGIWYESI